MMAKIPVGILGATGAVGQRFVQLLADHPWFEVAEVAASDRSAGKPYREACTWRLPGAPPDARRRPHGEDHRRPVPLEAALLRARLVGRGRSGDAPSPGAATPSSPTRATTGWTPTSRCSSPRSTPTTWTRSPASGERTGRRLHRHQPQLQRGGPGHGPGPPATRAFGLESVAVVTLQALSGAGYPGVASLDVADNVVPYIGGGEEEKIETRAAEDPRPLRRAAPSCTPPSPSPPPSTASPSRTATP